MWTKPVIEVYQLPLGVESAAIPSLSLVCDRGASSGCK